MENYETIQKLDLASYHIRQAMDEICQACGGMDRDIKERFEDILYEIDQERKTYIDSYFKRGLT